MRRDRIVIAGVSTRAFAESAWRAGFACETVDAFGDLDQKARVRNVSFHRDLGRQYSAYAAATASRRLSACAAAYVGNFENHPAAVRRLAAGRVLLGNTPDVLARARDPFLLADVVAAAGARVPLTIRPDDAWRADAGRPWLRKPMRGGGGSGVRPWRPGDPLDAHEIAQEYVKGMPASMVFLADGRRAILLGLSRQLTNRSFPQLISSAPQRADAGRGVYERAQSSSLPSDRAVLSGGRALDAFGASAFRYAGSLYPLCWPTLESRVDPAAHVSLQDRAAAVATAVTAAFGLRGVNGLDFMLRHDELFVLELNPRYPASAELIERATGLSIFEAHVEACLGRISVASSELRSVPGGDASGVAGWTCIAGSKPQTQRAMPHRQPPSVWGKAILYARSHLVVRDSCTLLDDDGVRDIPFPGERIPPGRPVCTVLARGVDDAECRTRLRAAAQGVAAHLRRS